jgi:hypothetical protein
MGKKKSRIFLLIFNVCQRRKNNSNLSIPRIMSFVVKSYYPGIQSGPKVMTSTNGLIFLIPQCYADKLLPLIPSIMVCRGIFTIYIT